MAAGGPVCTQHLRLFASPGRERAESSTGNPPRASSFGLANCLSTCSSGKATGLLRPRPPRSSAVGDEALQTCTDSFFNSKWTSDLDKKALFQDLQYLERAATKTCMFPNEKHRKEDSGSRH